MKEQFVTYEIALALKELGFDEECIAAFSDDEYHDLISLTEDVSEGDFIISEFKYGTLAPLWQQVIDWFRKKYDIHIVITVNPYSEIDEVNGYKIYMMGKINLQCIINNETQTWSSYKTREKSILKAIELCQKEK